MESLYYMIIIIGHDHHAPIACSVNYSDNVMLCLTCLDILLKYMEVIYGKFSKLSLFQKRARSVE